jgi:hypothetical protein
MIVIGANDSLCNLVWDNSLYEVVAEDKLGRVCSLDELGSTICLPIGYAVSGILADHFSPALVFLVGGGATIVCALLGLVHPKVYTFD